MKKQTLYLIFAAIFGTLTFCGAGHVLYSEGKLNAGFAVIPMLIELVCLMLYRAEKLKNK